MKINKIKPGQEFKDGDIDEKISVHRAESFGWRSWAITDNKSTIIIGWDIGNTNYIAKAKIEAKENDLKQVLKSIGIKLISNKRKYLEACKAMNTGMLKESLKSPSKYMKPIHLKLIAIELRNRGELQTVL